MARRVAWSSDCSCWFVGLCLQVCFEFIGNEVCGTDDEDYDDSDGWQMLGIVENEVEYIFRKAIKVFLAVTLIVMHELNLWEN